MVGKKGAKSAASAPPKSFQFNDIVLGKIKGYPPWPAKVVDPENEILLDAVKKPSNKLNNVLIKFLGGKTAEYQWSSPKDLKELSESTIDSWLSGAKRGGLLKNAYSVAKDPADWEASVKEDQQRAIDLEKRRLEHPEEFLDEDDDPDAEVGAKRKRAPSKPKASKKSKTENGAAKKEPKPKKEKKPKDVDPEIENTPEAKKCREWRNKLQKAFLSDKKVPKPEDMPMFDKLYKDIEAFEAQRDYLVSSKLSKVVKRIALLEPSIPRDDEFHIKRRSAELVQKWAALLAEDDNDDAPPSALPKIANGADEEPKNLEEAAIDAVAANGDAEAKAE